MKVTVDTNILISGTLWSGDSDRILTLAEENKIRLILSEEIIEEYKEALEYEEIKEKIKIKKLQIKRSIEKIKSIADIVTPQRKIDIIKDDPDDNRILECADTGKVSCIITQDNHLLKIKEFEGIKICTPREFLKEYNKQKDPTDEKT